MTIDEHLNRIGAALRLFDGTRECLEALESLTALRATIAEMEQQRDKQAERINALEEALRGLIDAVGGCTCAEFWKPYGKVDPGCAYHDNEREIIAARAALAPPATP